HEELAGLTTLPLKNKIGMKFNWIATSLVAGSITFFIAYLLIRDWKISLISGVIVLILVLLKNPIKRYMNAFYVVLFPLLSNIFFMFNWKKDGIEINVELNGIATVPNFILGIIAVLCLLLDYLQRNGKLKGTIFTNRNNKVGNIKGDNN